MTPEKQRDYEMLARGNQDRATLEILQALRETQADNIQLARRLQAAEASLDKAHEKLHAIRSLTEWK